VESVERVSRACGAAIDRRAPFLFPIRPSRFSRLIDEPTPQRADPTAPR
jgi:hypothetical protein